MQQAGGVGSQWPGSPEPLTTLINMGPGHVTFLSTVSNVFVVGFELAPLSPLCLKGWQFNDLTKVALHNPL